MSGLGLQHGLPELVSGRLPVIFLSAGNSNYAERALRGGAVDFLRKPFDPERLLANIESALR